MSTFAEQQAAVIPARFDASAAADVKAQINVRHGWVWAQEDWPFKHATAATLTVAAQTVSADTALGAIILRPERVYDDQGEELPYLEFPDMRRQMLTSTGTGRPAAWSWQDRTFYFDTAPGSSFAFTTDYLRRLHHVESGALVVGPMVDATDEPAWALEYESDLWLAAGAAAALMKILNDPTYPPLEDEFQQGYQGLLAELLPDRPSGSLQYGMEQF